MADIRPLIVGTVNGSDVSELRELSDVDRLLAPAGVADSTGVLISRVGGIPEVNGEPIDDTLQRTTDARIKGGTSPRGPAPYQDLPSGVVVLAQQDGLWSVGTRLSSAESNPELLSASYQTRATGSYTGFVTAEPAVDAIVTGSSGWTARVESIDTGAKTFVLSVHTGTTVSDATITYSAGSLTGCTVQANKTTHYADVTLLSGTTIRHSPKRGATGGWYNAIGVGPDTNNGSRFPLLPVMFNRGFRFPKAMFVEGAKLEIDIFGVIGNTTPVGDAPKLSVILAIGHNIFDMTSLSASNLAFYTEFLTPAMPVISSEVPFKFRIEGTASRKLDRTQGQIFTGTLQMSAGVWGGSGAWTGATQRGTDKLVAPTSFVGYDLEDGEDATEKRDLKYASVFMAVDPDVATSGSFYVTAHTFQARLIKGTR